MTLSLATSTTNVALLPNWLNPEWLLAGLGPTVVAVLCLILFAESSVFPVLPGDSLLFTAGLFMANGALKVPLWLVCLLAIGAAVAGNAVGFGIGWKVGPALFKRADSRFFKKEYLDKTHAFLEKYGPRAIVLARFVPFVRTFITWLAGAGRMEPKKYFTFTILGGVLWAGGLIVLGYLLGDIPFIKKNVEAIFIVIVAVSVVPMVVEYVKARKEKKATKSAAS